MEHSTFIAELSGICSEDRVEGWPPVTMSDPADQLVLMELKSALADVIAAQGTTGPADAATARAVRAAVDGAELTACAELMIGNREGLQELVPSFFYLAVLPLAGEAAALQAAFGSASVGSRLAGI